MLKDFDLNLIAHFPWRLGSELNAKERLDGCKALQEVIERHLCDRKGEVALMQKRLDELKLVQMELSKDAAMIAAMDASEPLPAEWEETPTVFLKCSKWEAVA